MQKRPRMRGRDGRAHGLPRSGGVRGELPALQRRGGEPPPYQGGVDPQGLGEGVLAALEGLLQRGLAHGAHVRGADLKAQGDRAPVKDEREIPVAEVGHQQVHVGAPVHRAAVHAACQDAFDDGSLAVGLSRAEPVCQRAQDLVGGVRAGDQPVQPAGTDRNAPLQPEIQQPRFKIAAGGKNGVQREGGDRPPVFRVLFRPRTGVGNRFGIHVV